LKHTQKEAVFLFLLITVSGFIYYLLNNEYSLWAYTTGANFWLAVLAYYFLSQPIYVLFLWLMHGKYGGRGFLAAILFMVASDIMSLPHSIPSLWQAGEATPLPSDANLAPYGDWQLGRFLAVGGVLTFEQVIFIYVILPTLLNLVAFLAVKPKAYTELVEHS
jgi:hypothetical protein